MFPRVQPYLRTGFWLLLIVYFVFHAVTGQGGLLTAHARRTALEARQAELKSLMAQRADLESRVRLLSTAHLSRDLLDERARALLGFAGPNDYVVHVSEAAPARS